MKRIPFPLKSEPTAATADASVRVAGGYQPDTILAQAGTPLRITFRREETSPCSERVVFPDLGVDALLPANEDVVVDVLPEQPGEYSFSCGMGMLQGRLIVTGAEGEE